jgi:MFS family permease
MAADLGWSRAQLVSGFSLALVVSAAAAVPAGRWLDRHPPRALMTAGSVAAVALVVAWSQVGSPQAYLLIWAGIGIVMALVLYEPAMIALTKHCRPDPRTALTT